MAATSYNLPYGISKLQPRLERNRVNGKVACPVRRCNHWLVPPTRKKGTGEACPKHGIYVHSSGTYRYANPVHNVIVDHDFFRQRILGNGFKYETHRLGMERSEDTLTYNVFRSLQQAGLLHEVMRLCTGLTYRIEPKLYLWGLEMCVDAVCPWDLLIQARERFESDLPVNRPLTEPDIGLFIPGRVLVLIEAKFTSGNTFYERDRKTKLLDLTLGQLLQIYHDPNLEILDYEVARQRDRIPPQLWRNMLFAEHMSAADGPATKAYHVNLVREGFEEEVCEEFLGLIHKPYHERFEQITWEDIYRAVQHKPGVERLCQYLEQKTERFKSAFNIDKATA